MMKPIKSENEYNKALQRFEEIFQAEIGTKESDEADILAAFIKEYEDKYYPISFPSRA